MPVAQNFLSSIGIHLKPKIMSNREADGSSTHFAGINVPIAGNIGFTLKGGEIKFGQYNDPRAALRNLANNKVDINADSGKSSKYAVPSSTGGKLENKDMTFEQLQKKLLATNSLFEDPDFPAEPSSIFFSQPPRGLQWKRPKEICSRPQFVASGASRFDVMQGELGDCWLLAAIANISLYDDLLDQIILADQTFDKDYCGMFRFRFWRFGEWVEVVIDDRLPVRNNKLVFMHSADSSEFWSALLEKAYAKLFSSYEALKGGSTIEALEDFTGGLAEFFDLNGKEISNLDTIMLKSYKHRSLMACSIDADPNVTEAKLLNGLIRGHAYSITKVTSINHRNTRTVLVRIRNPWGNEAEWTGRWSDKSSEWNSVEGREKQELGLNFAADGEFWMCYEDFVREFSKLEICCLGPQSLDTSGKSDKVVFEMTVENGSWQPGVNAGGCRNFLETFWTNPQFHVCLEDADGDEDDKGTLIVGLMQKNRRKLREKGLEMCTIGFMIYQLENDSKNVLKMDFFKYHSAVAKSPAFSNVREITGRFLLPPGNYVIIPSTFHKNVACEFLLRIFTESSSTSQQLDDEIGISDVAPGMSSSLPDPINDSQTASLKSAFDKVAGGEGEIVAEDLVDILNVAFKKELKMQSNNNDDEKPVKPKSSASKQLMCCVFATSKEAENTNGLVFEGFSMEAGRTLVAMMDVDRSGTLCFEEFVSLWERLRHWKAVFKKFDADGSGSVSTYELRSALEEIGFHINNATLGTLVLRFGNREQVLQFDEYIICCARLTTALQTIQASHGQNLSDAQLLNSLLYL